MSTMTKGTDLKPTTQREVLARFVHRFTGDHRPAWANKPRPDGTAYPLQFKDDADWLANTFFAINRDGSLSAKQHFCSSTPTWPDNPELRKMSPAKATGFAPAVISDASVEVAVGPSK